MSKNELVQKYILDKIEKRIYSTGQMIESEMVLSKKLKVSRMTVRKALDSLVDEGIIYKEQGRGTFVARRPKYAEFKCGVGFSEEAKRRGLTPSTKQSSLEITMADEKLAKKLKINIGDKVWKVNRVRCTNEIPVIFATEYYIYSQCEELNLDIVNSSIYEYLETKGIKFAFADQKIEAIKCPKTVASSLNIESGSPVILMSLIAYTRNGMPFNCGYEYYCTDKFTLVQSVYQNN